MPALDAEDMAFLQEAPPEKENFRACGRGSGGVEMPRNFRGQAFKSFTTRFSSSRPGTPRCGSIPGKFETTLFLAEKREDKGFGSQAPRFRGQAGHTGTYAAPGPGAHNVPTKFVARGAVCAEESCGSRGTGNFASRSSRLPKRPVEGPGPGAYVGGTDAAQGGARQVAPSPAFVRPRSFNPAKIYERPLPGPGEYERVPVDQTVGKAAMGGVIPRQSARGAQDWRQVEQIPGPADYDGRSVSLPPRGTLPFEGSTRRRPEHRVEGMPLAERVLRPGCVTNTSALASPRPRDVPAPGPGAYEQDGSTNQGSFSTAGTSSFQKGLSHLPRTWRAPEPGPGAYSPKNLGGEGSSAGAAFASGSARIKETANTANPGPAVYSPRKQDREQSFHLNIQRQWM